MRIIAGKYRRRKLQTNPGLVTRPITDRVKESLFENIEKRVIGTRVADVFAGTGTIGLEALSRGAECVTFLEKDRVAVRMLKENLEVLGCEEDCLVWPADIFRCSFKPKGKKAERFSPFDLIFFDPPYKLVSEIREGSPLWQALARLGRPDVSSENATLIFRTPERAEFDLPDCWKFDWTMEMSNMKLHICNRSSDLDDLMGGTPNA